MEDTQKKIREIQRDTNLSSEEKTKKIREVMQNNNKNLTKKKEKKNIFTLNNVSNIVCEHYKKGCDVECPTCNKFYPCRLCHDTYEDHKLDRFGINKIRCKKCKFIQTPSQKCINCNSLFGFYYCPICHLWEFTNKCIFHCDKCGICRVGRKQDFVHCDKCNMCITRKHYENGHKCVENSTKANCPVCNEYMFDSTENTSVLPCGHSMHEDCLKNLISKKKFQCPLCKKSIIDMKEHWLAKDQLANLEMIPFSYMKKRLIILCNDCEKKSDIKFSFEFKKCSHCGGYNTTDVELYDT